VLSAGAARAVGVDAQILLVDADVHVLGQLRPHEHRRKRRMAAGSLVERRDADETMDAGFCRHEAKAVIAGQHECRALDARFLAGLVVDDLALEAAALRPLEVHAEQHLGPVLRLGTARARMDGDDCVGAIVFAAEHLLRLGRLDLLLELVEAASEIGGDVLAGVDPLEQHAEIVRTPLQRPEERLVFLQPPAALHDLLRLVLVAPERGRVDPLFYVGQLRVEAGTLKGTSGVPPRVGSSRRVAL
jgi:hypothetical protein